MGKFMGWECKWIAASPGAGQQRGSRQRQTLQNFAKLIPVFWKFRLGNAIAATLRLAPKALAAPLAKAHSGGLNGHPCKTWHELCCMDTKLAEVLTPKPGLQRFFYFLFLTARRNLMRMNKTAVMLAVAGLSLVSSVAWSQVTIGTNVGGTITPGAPNTNAGATTLGKISVPALTATNGGAGINAAGASLSAIGGAGGPSGTPSLAQSAAGFGTGLAGTSHDFISGTGSSGTSNTTAGLCTYCHTPHQAKSTLLLWNHTLSTATFQWDVAATTSGTALPGFTGNAYNGPSAKCLSCHDGSVAIGDVGWFGEASHTAVGGGTPLEVFKITAANTKNVGAGGNLSGTHPVAIPYPLNGAPNVYNGSTTGAQLATNDFVADPSAANNMRLYSDIGGGAIVGKTTPGKSGIECSTCHDPHNKAAKDDFFLRGNLAGGTQASGYICLQCHVK